MRQETEELYSAKRLTGHYQAIVRLYPTAEEGLFLNALFLSPYIIRLLYYLIRSTL